MKKHMYEVHVALNRLKIENGGKTGLGLENHFSYFSLVSSHHFLSPPFPARVNVFF